MQALRALEPPRHACHACGACCHGVRIRLLCDEETERIARIGAELGVPDPIEDGRLRFAEGRCVFLQTDGLCRIHRERGPEAKPLLCRQYPAVLVHTETDFRVGIDPGCLTLHASWRDGAPIDPETPMAPNAVVRDPDQACSERALLQLAAAPGATVAGLLAHLSFQPAAPGLPEGMAGRWVQRLQEAQLARLLLRPDAGEVVRGALMPVVRAAEGWDPAAPPPWPVLGEEEEAFAVEVFRRILFLRLVSTLPTVAGVALLGLLGAVACAWTDPRPAAFGPAMSAWSRALRAPPFWSALAPDPGVLRGLALG